MTTKIVKNLMIVESPSKAKTIEKYLGKDWRVLSSVGHIRRIPTDKTAVDIAGGFVAKYEIDPEKKKVVSELKKAVKEADTVWLATDADREGEAISWHLAQVIGLPVDETNRITFHEITKPALEEAVKNPGHIDMKMVAAQQARQVLDRLVGFELSPVVWRKVPGGKSAGRVQSPAVRLLVEREREIRAFDSKSDFAVAGEFAKGRSKIKAAVEKHLASVEEARKLFGDLIGAIFKVDKVDKTPSLRNPGIPFTTSALQQEASAKLGYSAKTTMSAAQKLYQAGHITYMRTDAPTLSGQAIAMIGNYIKNEFGEEYHKVRNFKAKSANAQEAHEAIRPTHVEYKDCGTTSYEKKVYDLIWRRAVASQMVPAEMEKTTINIVNDKNACIFVAKGEVVVKEGFLKVYGGGKDITLPVLGVGDEVKAGEIVARQVFAKPPARYTEGSLVKELEKRGIGRPSTYATILDTIQVRGYAEKGESEGEEREVDEIVLVDGEVSERKAIEKTGANKGKLVPTAAGEVLTSFLTEYFGEVVDYGFTAKTEKELDEIAEGRIERAKMLGAFYEPFHALIEKSGEIDRSKVAQARQIGESPSGLPIFVRFGKFGPYVQEGEDDFEGKRRASLPRGVSLEAVDMKVALKALELPRRVGVFDDGTEVLANVGRFGPYIKVGDKFVSIKAFDPREITLEEALGVWKDKLKADAEKHVRKLEGGIEILKGQYGLYITDGKMNAKFPKDADPLLIPEKEVLEIFEKNKSVPKKRSWGRRKK